MEATLHTYPHGYVAELDGPVGVDDDGEGVDGEAVLVHDPCHLGALGQAALVEDESLLDADALAGGGVMDGLVGAGGLPVAAAGGAVGADAVRVLVVPRAEEVPLAVAVHRLGCSFIDHQSPTMVSKQSRDRIQR
ncbi:NAC transcription factor [Hordeum vulgare]|nr:NAC transcription factor [Hordeum vulgare]